MTSSKMTSSKGLSYDEMRILWNEGEFASFEGKNSHAWFSSGEPRMALVYDGLHGGHGETDPHDTFNSFWLVWGNWQEYKRI